MEGIRRRIGETDLALVIGDITRRSTEAIVNAANPSLSGGGGVDGAIHRAGGPAILSACQDYVRAHGPLSPGEAMWTPGGDLPARVVIHTVGPVYRDAAGSAPILARAYTSCLELAESLGVSSLAFPSISTGAYGYPVDEAAPVAVRALAAYLRRGASMSRVEIVCFAPRTYSAFASALQEALA